MNVFPYETIASNEEFFGRDDEVAIINDSIDNSSNLVIFSKRRMGKSSLVKEVMLRIEETRKDILCIYTDVYDMTSAEDFATLLLQGLTSAYKGDMVDTLKKLTSLFKRTRVEPTFNANTAEYGIKPIVTALTLEEQLDDFFESLYKISKEKKIVVAIDEFQQISTIKDKKIDALFRKYVQDKRCKNISFIFLGSKRHMLTSLFEYNAPMFELATPLELLPLHLDDIYNYASLHLKVDEDTIKYIYNLCDGETKLMQHIFFLLYSKHKEKAISTDIVEDIVAEILSYKTSLYRALLDTFTINQKKALKLILKYKNGLFSKAVLDEQSLSKNVMQSSINSLIEREILDKNDDIYFIPDRAFELWGKRVYISI